MNMFEEANALEGTIRMCGYTQSDIAKRLGVSQSYVANKLRLLSFPEDMKRAITDAGLTERHARAILKLKQEDTRRQALKKIIDGGLNVKESEALVDLLSDADIPYIISRAAELERTEAFKRALDEAVKSLKSFGIKASKSADSYGRKTYITICIEE